jgi:hypothetical protein
MTTHDPARLLRQCLQGNAWFSGLSGTLLLVAARLIVDFLGIEASWIIRTLGLGLILYAFWLFVAARRSSLDRREVLATIGLDAAWVLGSAVLLIALPIPMTLQGKWAIGIVADIVAMFAALQAYGLYRLNHAGILDHETR